MSAGPDAASAGAKGTAGPDAPGPDKAGSNAPGPDAPGPDAPGPDAPGAEKAGPGMPGRDKAGDCTGPGESIEDPSPPPTRGASPAGEDSVEVPLDAATPMGLPGAGKTSVGTDARESGTRSAAPEPTGTCGEARPCAFELTAALRVAATPSASGLLGAPRVAATPSASRLTAAPRVAGNALRPPGTPCALRGADGAGPLVDGSVWAGLSADGDLPGAARRAAMLSVLRVASS